MDKRAAEIMLNQTFATIEQMEKLLSFSHLNCDDDLKGRTLNLLGNQMLYIKLQIMNEIYKYHPELEKTYEKSFDKYRRFF